MNKIFIINPKQKKATKKTETVTEYLQRGGKINKIPNINSLYCIDSINRTILNEYIKGSVGGKRPEAKKVYDFCYRLFNKINFVMITEYEKRILKNAMETIGLELVIKNDKFSLKRNNMSKSVNLKSSKKIVKEISDMFLDGISLIDIRKNVEDKYSYDFDILEIVSIINQEMGNK